MKTMSSAAICLTKGIKLFLLMILVLSMMTISAQAQTPALESVCDPLKADDVTKGLYGLCVAFCEAQDFASEDVALTKEEILALANDTPSGRILENYNKRKTANDPEMPCIVPKEDSLCPCFGQSDIDRIDGTTDDLQPYDLEYGCGPSGPGWLAFERYSSVYVDAAVVSFTDANQDFCQWYVQRDGDIKEYSLFGHLTNYQVTDCIRLIEESCLSQ